MLIYKRWIEKAVGRERKWERWKEWGRKRIIDRPVTRTGKSNKKSKGRNNDALGKRYNVEVLPRRVYSDQVKGR